MIHILDENLISKIAAGEVVERPASVVKELIENSLDANATIISIDVKEGGISYIKVSDNGTGMDEKDAKLSIQRHATSKINDLNDLFAIRTLGFRGEALASIFAVANLKLTTKIKKDLEGTFIEGEGSKILKTTKIGCANGTIIEVSDLFFNTPARKKYLKPISVEFSHILDVVIRYSLIHPDVFFKLSHNNKLILSSPKSKDMLSNIISIYGMDIGKNLIPVNYLNDFASIKGYICKPSITRNDKEQQSIYVNGRYIKNKIISNAVYDAYHTLLFLSRQPIYVLMLDIEASKIDVNVHPTKDIIRVKKEEELYDFVFEAIKDSLQNNNLIPEVSVEQTKAKPTKKYQFITDKQSVLVAKDEVKEEKPEPVIVKEEIGPVLIHGQVNRTYIIAENNKGLLIIDQHAAQERIFYEQFMDMYKRNGVITQKLLKPKIVELSPVEANNVKDNLDLLKKLGFETEEYGRNTFIVRTIPFIFERNYSSLISDVIHELGSKTIDVSETYRWSKTRGQSPLSSTKGGMFLSTLKNHPITKGTHKYMPPSKSKVFDALKEERIIRFACRKAIKAGDELTKDEMKELIENLDKTKQPYSCPHGRPTMINISLSELEKKFKRVA